MYLFTSNKAGTFASELVRPLLYFFTFLGLLLVGAADAMAHAVAEGDKGFIQESTGVMFLPFVYMGAKHMITAPDSYRGGGGSSIAIHRRNAF